MADLKGWCIINYGNGSVGRSATHSFRPYKTWFKRKPMYYCWCGKKITPDEYEIYSKYLIKREQAIKAYMEKL